MSSIDYQIYKYVDSGISYQVELLIASKLYERLQNYRLINVTELRCLQPWFQNCGDDIMSVGGGHVVNGHLNTHPGLTIRASPPGGF